MTEPNVSARDLKPSVTFSISSVSPVSSAREIHGRCSSVIVECNTFGCASMVRLISIRVACDPEGADPVFSSVPLVPLDAVEPEEPSFFRADSLFINAEDGSSQRLPSVVELSSEFGWVEELAAGSSG